MNKENKFPIKSMGKIRLKILLGFEKIRIFASSISSIISTKKIHNAIYSNYFTSLGRKTFIQKQEMKKQVWANLKSSSKRNKVIKKCRNFFKSILMSNIAAMNLWV